MKKLIALLLVIVMCLTALIACKKTETDGTGSSDSQSIDGTESGDTDATDGSDSDSTGTNGDSAGSDGSGEVSDTGTEEIEIPKVSFFGEEDTFFIVYPDECTDELIAKANALKANLELVFPDMTFFVVNANKEWGDISFEKNEILIGDTGRAESYEVLLSLSSKQFAIKLADSGKLVIAGAEDSLTIEAINYFSVHYVNPAYESQMLMLEENLYYTETNHNIPRSGWQLTSIPSYEGGTLDGVAHANGADISFVASSGKMQVIYDTDLSEFNKYLSDLETAGYSRIFKHTIANNQYVQYSNGTKLIYAYYTPTENQAKVVYEGVGTTPVRDFSYSYTAKAGDTSSFYQYAIMHNAKGQGGHNDTNLLWENCGLFDVIKLADNSVILLDGGWDPQATDKAVDACMDFLREITGTPKGEKVRIAAIYITHNHDDHMSFAYKLVENHTDEVVLERVMHNILISPAGGEFGQMGKSIQKNFPQAKFLQLHTGQKIQLANATIEVLYTHEDLYHRTDLPMNGSYDTNNSSAILKMTMNGRTFLLPGDWSGGHVNRDKYEYKGMEASLLNSMKLSDGSSYLKCDVLQIPHHAINDWIDNFLAAVDPDVAFIPQQDVEKKYFAHSCYTNVVNSLNKLGIDNQNIFFAGRYTYGITVALDGTMTLSYRDIAGYDDAYKTMVLDAYKPFHQPSSGVLPF